MCLTFVKVFKLLRLDWECIIMQNLVLQNNADSLVEDELAQGFKVRDSMT